MKLTLGFMNVEYVGNDETTKKLNYNGQVCVDGVETFIAKKTNGSFRLYCYGKREFVYDQVIEEFGEDLEAKIDELAKIKSVDIKAAKKNLAGLRKAERDKLKKIKNKQ